MKVRGSGSFILNEEEFDKFFEKPKPDVWDVVITREDGSKLTFPACRIADAEEGFITWETDKITMPAETPEDIYHICKLLFPYYDSWGVIEQHITFYNLR